MKDSSYPKNFSYFLSGLVFAFTILMPGISDATTYYVAKTGNDSNPGTEISPFRNIKFGVSQLSPGDTLYVKAGTYNESIHSWKTTIPNGTSWSNPVTVATKPGDIVTINPPSGEAFFWIQDGQAKYLIIAGFIVDGQNIAIHGYKFSNNSRYIRVKDSEIKNSKNSGIQVTICAGCSNPSTAPHDSFHEFVNLTIHDNGSSIKDHGFYIETSKNIVEGSKIYNNSGNGGKFYHGNLPGVSNFNVARNNTFYNNSTSKEWSCGLILSSGDGNIAYNNIAYGNYAGFCILYRNTNARLFNNIAYENDHYGIYVGKNDTDKAYVGNNTVYNNSEFGIFVGDEAKNTTVSNNIAYLNKGENLGLQNQTGTIISHNLTSDPLFLAADAKDFRLKAQSPGIDKGDIINFISDDFAGNPRPQGSGYDIGAHEEIIEVDNNPPATPRDLVAN